MKLLFKNTGRYADEDSARYEASVKGLFKVRIFKDTYMKGFRFEFISNHGYTLDINRDLLASFYDKATKKQATKWVSEMLNEKEIFDSINKQAKSIDKMMADFTNKKK